MGTFDTTSSNVRRQISIGPAKTFLLRTQIGFVIVRGDEGPNDRDDRRGVRLRVRPGGKQWR